MNIISLVINERTLSENIEYLQGKLIVEEHDIDKITSTVCNICTASAGKTFKNELPRRNDQMILINHGSIKHVPQPAQNAYIIKRNQIKLLTILIFVAKNT